MRILLIHGFYQQFGGEDAVALSEKEQLERHGNDVIFYTRHNSEISGYKASEAGLLPFRSLYSTRTVREIRSLVAETRPDIAYVHNFFPLLSPSLYHVLSEMAVPTVQALHDFRFLCPNGWFYTQRQVCERCRCGNYLHAVRYRCYRDSRAATAVAAAVAAVCRVSRVFDKIDGFIALTKFIQDKFVESGISKERIFIKPHFIGSSDVVPCYGDGEYVLYLGRLSEEKGIWQLVKAFERCRGINLKIAGSGPLDQELRAYVVANNLSNIQFLGFATNTQKWEYLQKSRFLVVPSQCYETFSMVTLEAYAAGKPVIASDLGSLPYVIDHGKSGLLVTPGDIGALATTIQQLWNDPKAQHSMGMYARSLAQEKYSPQLNYQRLMAIFSSVTSLPATAEAFAQ